MSIAHGSLETKEENEILRDIMIAHGLPLPEKYQQKNTAVANVSVLGELGDQRLVVRMPDSGAQWPYFDNSSQARGLEKTSLSPRSQDNSFSGYHSMSPGSPQNIHPQGLGSTQVGVDFVLS
jgi:hypothetical protein